MRASLFIFSVLFTVACSESVEERVPSNGVIQAVLDEGCEWSVAYIEEGNATFECDDAGACTCVVGDGEESVLDDPEICDDLEDIWTAPLRDLDNAEASISNLIATACGL